MDTSTFIVRRQNLINQMEADRALVGTRTSTPAVIPALVSAGMKWGIVPLLEEWAIANVGRWVFDKIRKRLHA